MGDGCPIFRRVPIFLVSFAGLLVEQKDPDAYSGCPGLGNNYLGTWRVGEMGAG